MKILLLTENTSISNENSPSRLKILEYASLVDTFFVIIANTFKKDSIKVEKLSENTWLYRTNSRYNFLQIFKILKLVSFEINIKKVFQADIIVCDDLFVKSFAGFLIARKFKKPLYIFFSEENEKYFFDYSGFRKFLQTRILWFVLKKADCIKVNNFITKEKLLKKSHALNIEVIKPSIDADTLISMSDNMDKEERSKNNIIKNIFPILRFTAVTFVNSTEEIKTAIEILRNINRHFPPISLVLLYSNNLKRKRVERFIPDDLRPFIYGEAIDSNVFNYLINSNVFMGISSGEKYEEVLSKAYILGMQIIALESDIAKELIEDNVTGFICPTINKQQIMNYFFDKTLLFMNSPVLGINFKMNRPVSFIEKFNVTKEEYERSIKLSLENCIKNHKEKNRR